MLFPSALLCELRLRETTRLSLPSPSVPAQLSLILAYLGRLPVYGRDEAVICFVLFAVHRFSIGEESQNTQGIFGNPHIMPPVTRFCRRPASDAGGGAYAEH